MEGKNKVLYQIRTLEKLIIRRYWVEKGFTKEDFENKMKKTSPTQMQIIEYMLKHDQEDVYQKDLEKVLRLRRATVSGVLQTMEKNNLISRITNQEDTRTKKIILNENTKKLFLENKKKFDEIEEKIIKGISNENLNLFFQVIEEMKKNIEREA